MGQRSVGKNYVAEAGHVARSDYHHFGPEISYIFLPNKHVVSHGIKFESNLYYDTDFIKLDQEDTYSYQFVFHRTDRNLHLDTGMYLLILENDFDILHFAFTIQKIN